MRRDGVAFQARMTGTQLAVRSAPLRALTITLGLACTGAVFGGLSGALVLALALILDPFHAQFGSFDYYELAASIGALLGAVSAPTVTWVMLPRVPFGRLFSLLTVGTIAGGVFGWFALSGLDIVFGPTLAAFTGFLSTAIALSFRYDTQPRLPKRRRIAH